MLPSRDNPIKRNRKIGTKRAGYRKQSDFRIPWQGRAPFYENLESAELYQREINGKRYSFAVEKLKRGYRHICSVDEICDVIKYVPEEDLEGLSLIVLRQPKKKEEIFSPCWGRLQYDYKYGNRTQPAILLEALDLGRPMKIRKTGISPFFRKELNRLEKEGAEILNDKRRLTVRITFQSAKNIQLYRTLLHEVRHYVSYKKGCRVNCYEENEAYANRYAAHIKSLLPPAFEHEAAFRAEGKGRKTVKKYFLRNTP